MELTVPEGQWCSTFDWQGSTPELSVENIPTWTKALSMSYSDRSFAANDNGWHWIVWITIQDELSYVDVPSIAWESLELPENMFVIEEARSSRSSGWAYLPPCSGWNGNEYYLTVTALDSTDVATANVLATQDIEMWVY